MKYSPQSCHNPHGPLYLAEFSDCCLRALDYCFRMMLFLLINLLLVTGEERMCTLAGGRYQGSPQGRLGTQLCYLGLLDCV